MNRSSAPYQVILNNQARNYNLVYLAIFGGISTGGLGGFGGVGGVTSPGISMRFSTGPVTDPQGPTSAYMLIPSGAGAQITPAQGTSSLANTNIDIVDYNGQVTELMRTYQMANRKITLKQGFVGMPEADYLTVAEGLVQDYQLQNDNMVWRFTLTTLMSQEQNNIFDAFCTLVQNVGLTDTTIYVDSTSEFPYATNGCCYLFLGSEAISYTGTTPGSFTGCARGQLGTTPQTGSIGDQPVNLIVLQGQPLTLALEILTSTGSGANGPFDILPACAGLAIPYQQVDIQSFLTQQTQWVPGLQLRFEESASVVGKDFLEQQIFTAANCYPLIENNGQIGVHVYGPVMPQSEVPLVTDDDLAGVPTWSGSLLGRYFFNQVDIEYDYNFITGNDDSQALFEDATSQQAFGKVVTWQDGAVELRGFRTNVTGLEQIQAWAQRILQRFGSGQAPVSAEMMFSECLLSPGDIVPITTKYLPDLTTGTKGVVAHLYELIEIQPDYKKGTQKLTLLDTGYTYGARYCAISPSGYPVYTAATPQQKNYGFICQKLTDSSGIMGNGDAGYLITQ